MLCYCDQDVERIEARLRSLEAELEELQQGAAEQAAIDGVVATMSSLRKQLQVQLDTHRSSQDDHAAKIEELLAKVAGAQTKLSQQVAGSLGAMQRGLEHSAATAAAQHQAQYEELPEDDPPFLSRQRRASSWSTRLRFVEGDVPSTVCVGGNSFLGVEMDGPGRPVGTARLYA